MTGPLKWRKAVRMMSRNTLATAVAAVLLSGTAMAAAASNDDDKVDMQSLHAAKITVTEAIHAAEKAKNGQVWSASLINRKGQPAYEVHLLASNGAASSVIVDGQTGQVAPDPGDAGENESASEPEEAE